MSIELLELACNKVNEGGYHFKKGELFKAVADCLTPKWPKSSESLRIEYIKVLQDIKDLSDRLKYKEKRRDQPASSINYKICDQLTEEVAAVKKRKSVRKSYVSGTQSSNKPIGTRRTVQMQVISFRLIHLMNVIMRLDSR